MWINAILPYRDIAKLQKLRYNLNMRKIVVGIDEVGRGPLAGPVVACAFCLDNKVEVRPLPYLRDSKQLSPKQREEIYKILRNNVQVKWGIGEVSEKIIDEINILQATKLAMIKAVKDLEKKIKPDYLLIDGNFAININIPQKSIIRGDEKIPCISAASIIAKVTRDRIMINYHRQYPQYLFNIHKGYSTALHRQKIKEFGLCPLHRVSFCCG